MTSTRTRRMHVDEVETDAALVHELLRAQFPTWAALPIHKVDSAGTDHAIYRLGDFMAVRLPRIPSVAVQVAREQQWLPQLAPHLPLAIPTPLAHGMPGAGYPWNWSVYSWLEGENPILARLDDPAQAATQLARFIIALRQINTAGAPPPGPENNQRGCALALRDERTRAAIASLRGQIDSAAVTAAWDAALQAPVGRAAPVWIHGDLQAGNLLTIQGRINAVIDFGCMAVGDCACDLMVAWNFLDGATRAVFRHALSVDDATWARGLGWALSVALIALPYYEHTNPTLATSARRTIAQVLGDS